MVEHLFGEAEEDAEEEVDRVERVAPVALQGAHSSQLRVLCAQCT